MKFLCDQCKAKYQIADEKVQGKTLKMKCRKCGHVIEIRASGGDSSPSLVPGPGGNPTMQLSALDDAGEPIAAKLPAGAATAQRPATTAAKPATPPRAGATTPRPTASAPRATAKSPGEAAKPGARPNAGALSRDAANKSDSALANAFSKVASGSDPPPQRAGADLPAEEWYCAIDGVPVGPIRLTDLRSKYAEGAVTGDSLVWREGFEEWRPLITLPDLHQLVREEVSVAGPAPRAGSSLPGTSGGMRGRSGSTTGTGMPRATSGRSTGTMQAVGGARGGNVIPFTRQGGAAARKVDDEPFDEEVTRIAEAPILDPGAIALAKAGLGSTPVEPKITEDPFGSKPAALPLVNLGDSGALGTAALATGSASDSGRASMADAIVVRAKGMKPIYGVLIGVGMLVLGMGIMAAVMKPRIVTVTNETIKEVQVPGAPSIVYRDAPASQTAPSASASAAPKVASAAKVGTDTTPDPPPGSNAPTTPIKKPQRGIGDPEPPEPVGPSTSLSGPLDAGEVSKVVSAKRIWVRKRCVDSQGGTGLPASVTLTITVNPDGTTGGVDLAQSSGDTLIGSCLQREARNWRYPPSGSGTTVKVPFFFGS